MVIDGSDSNKVVVTGTSANGNTEYAYSPLGSTLTTGGLLNFKFKLLSASGNAVNYEPIFLHNKLSGNPHTTSTGFESMGVGINTNLKTMYPMYKDTGDNGWRSDISGAVTLSTNTDYWVSVSLASDGVTQSLKIYTNEARTTQHGSTQTTTIPIALTDLKSVIISTTDFASGAGYNASYEIDDLKIYDGVTTPTPAKWTLNPTYEEDFSSDNWVDSDSTNMGVSCGSFNWNAKRDGTNDASVYDLVSTKANWVLRFKLHVTCVSGSTQAGNGFYVGLSDSVQTAGQSTSQDFIGVSIYNDNSDTYRAIDADGSAIPAIYQGDSYQATTYNTGSIWYYEIIKTGSSYTVEAFSGSDYSTGSEGRLTGSSDASGLRYLKVLNDMDSIATSTDPFQGTIDDIKFYNGVTSL